MVFYNNLKNKLPVSLRIKLSDLKRKFLVLFRRLNLGALKMYISGFGGKSNEKRILGIWDFESSNIAVGVLIEFQTRLLCDAYSDNLNKIDIAFIYNPEQPLVHPKFSSWINASNFYHHFQEVLPILNINPKLGSIFLFDSREKFELFLKQNKNNYYFQPSLSHYFNRVGAFSDNYVVISHFYMKNNFVPKLEFKSATNEWVRIFIKKNIGSKIMVTVNLRLNSQFTPERNSNLEAWSELFEHSKEKSPDIIFVILGRKGELNDEFKNFSNIIFSKDYNTNIEQDLALIQHAFFHMGTTSGPASFAVLSEDIPYIITNFRPPDKNDENWLKPGSGFNKEFQRLIWEKETGELLIKEFKDLYGKIDKSEWRDKLRFGRS